MKNNNGFEDQLKQMKTLLDVNEKATINVLEDAANYFAEKLKPKIPISNKRGKHMRDTLKVIVEDDVVKVVFGTEAWYWHLVEHGHKKRAGRGRVKGRHFVRNTWDAEANKIEEIMLDKIIKKMEG